MDSGAIENAKNHFAELVKQQMARVERMKAAPDWIDYQALDTIHIGIELINRSGQADHVIAILDAIAPGASQPDPYVEIVSNTVVLQGIGPFARATTSASLSPPSLGAKPSSCPPTR